MSYPERIQQHKNEDKSFAIIKKDLIELGVFRDQTNNDYGVDFEIEIENNGRMEGHCLKVQVKSSDDLNIRNDGHATVGGIKQSTLNYWAEISYNQPVVGMAVDLDGSEKIYVSGLLFWQVIKNIEPSGDEIKRDDKGRLIAPPTKTVDFGNECDNQKNIEKLRKLAYGYSLRDFLNAHKWLLTNIKKVFQMYSDAAYCDRYTPIYNPKLFKMFLQQAKTFIYYDFGWREKGENLDVVFDYQTYVNKSNGDDPYNIEVEKGMKPILKKILLPLIQKYRNWVLDATYYWLNKDLQYIKLVFDTDYPDWNDDDAMLNFGYDETKPQRGTVDWIGFIDEQQKKYKISDNSLVVKALR